MSELKRLRWRCRRGMRELDLLLTGFVERDGLAWCDAELRAVERLLDYPDDHLLALLLGRSAAPDAGLAHVIDKIQSATARKA